MAQTPTANRRASAGAVSKRASRASFFLFLGFIDNNHVHKPLPTTTSHRRPPPPLRMPGNDGPRMINLFVYPSSPSIPTPSLSGECIAALALLTLLSEQSPSLRWRAVPTFNESESPAGELPSLECSCGGRLAGYARIVRHLRACRGEEGDLDKWMEGSGGEERANCAA